MGNILPKSSFKSETLSDMKSIDPRDLYFINALKSGDREGIHQLFYLELRPLLEGILRHVYKGTVDYDGMVNELFLHLSQDNWHRLDTFTASGESRLKAWMSPVAWRYFISNHAQYFMPEASDDDLKRLGQTPSHDSDPHALMDVESVFARMPNERYVRVLRLMLVDGFSPKETADILGTSVANVYNLKHRAIEQFINCFGEEVG